MARKRKFRRGSVVRSVTAVVALLLEGRWFYWHYKVQNPQWLLHNSIAMLKRAAEEGVLRLAEENEESDERPCGSP